MAMSGSPRSALRAETSLLMKLARRGDASGVGMVVGRQAELNWAPPLDGPSGIPTVVIVEQEPILPVDWIPAYLPAEREEFPDVPMLGLCSEKARPPEQFSSAIGHVSV